MLNPTIVVYIRDPQDIPTESAKTVVSRFWSFFLDVPVCSGREWQTMRAPEIAKFFEEEAVPALISEFEQARDEVVAEHMSHNFLIRFWKEIRGWKAPRVPPREEILDAIVEKCWGLARWMEINQHHPFYMDSDMSDFILKPKAVAQILTPRI